MRLLPYLFLLISIWACYSNVPIPDNLELLHLYEADQADREVEDIDWGYVFPRDQQRRARVTELLDSNKVITSADCYNAAMVFQHGSDSIAYGTAVRLMRKAIELDPSRDKSLLAAAIDRDLVSRDKPQIYGTQFFQMIGEPWIQRDIDTTQVTDAERLEYGVKTLAEQREQLR
ncbi:MAG: DUF6624 domain-containing protein, partial [Saprospiraceae bacterium]